MHNFNEYTFDPPFSPCYMYSLREIEDFEREEDLSLEDIYDYLDDQFNEYLKG